MANKSERQRTIVELIDARPVGSQEELRRLLLQRGWDVTQSTLSRDLREMRVARVPGPEGARYAVLNGADDEQRNSLDSLLPQFFHKADGVGELLVLSTTAGGAQPVAEAIDASGWPDVIGTIGGENTILVVCRSSQGRERITRKLRSLAGRSPD
ncbi:MAG: ArgR family transcriptional regulator [Gemmatimonadetes bacterium]|nr:ArgR family transcriptional regulator [Gemmatimonadota bacterium]